jgi:hypothetical protein
LRRWFDRRRCGRRLRASDREEQHEATQRASHGNPPSRRRGAMLRTDHSDVVPALTLPLFVRPATQCRYRRGRSWLAGYNIVPDLLGGCEKCRAGRRQKVHASCSVSC